MGLGIREMKWPLEEKRFHVELLPSELTMYEWKGVKIYQPFAPLQALE